MSKPKTQTENTLQSIKTYKRNIMQSAILALSTLIAIGFLCVAWLLNNTGINVQEAAVVGKTVGFSLATKGTQGVYDDDFNSFFGLVDGTAVTINGEVYYKSSANALVRLRVDGTSNFNNEQDVGVCPGSSGQLTFYILPTVDNLKEIRIGLNVTPYRIIENSEGNQSLLKITDLSILQLLQGHLLFFEEKNESDYRGWLSDGAITIATDSFENGVPYEITVFWVWPERFRNLAYFTDIHSTNLFTKPPSGEPLPTDYIALMADMNNSANWGKYYHLTQSDTINPPVASHEMQSFDFKLCNKYYNNADQLLGTNVHMIMVEIVTSET